MTRETKVGMVVAGSFVVLVGIVVASKMRGGGEPGGDEQAAKVTTGASEDSESHDKDKKPSAKIDLKEFPPKKSSDVRPAVAVEPAPKAGPPAPPPGPEKDFLPPPIPKDVQDDILKKLAMASKEPPMLPGFPPDAGPPLPPPGKDLPPPVAPPTIDPMKKAGMPPDLPPPPLKDDKGGPPPAPPPPVGPPGAEKDKKEGLPLTVEPPKMAEPPKMIEPPPPATFPGPVGPPPPAAFPTAKKEEPKDGPPILPLPPPPIAKKDGPPVGISPPITERKDGPPPLGAEFSKPAPPVGIAAPTPSPLPIVRSVEIPPYVLKADDISMDVVSGKVYGSERYGQALLAFNRDHPLAADDVRATPPRLTPGKMVYIPPKEMLESKYGKLIAEARPVIGTAPDPRPFSPPVAPVPPVIGAAPDPRPFSPPVAPVPPVKLAPPPVIGATPPPAPIPVSPVSLGSPMGPAAGAPPTSKEPTKRFVVAAPGQHILQIAQETLGDRNLWPRIYRLNPGIEPSQPIPGGTELRLPVEARTP